MASATSSTTLTATMAPVSSVAGVAAASLLQSDLPEIQSLEDYDPPVLTRGPGQGPPAASSAIPSTTRCMFARSWSSRPRMIRASRSGASSIAAVRPDGPGPRWTRC